MAKKKKTSITYLMIEYNSAIAKGDMVWADLAYEKIRQRWEELPSEKKQQYYFDTNTDFVNRLKSILPPQPALDLMQI